MSPRKLLGPKPQLVERKAAHALRIARAHDAGRQAGEAVMKLVDTYFDDKVVPVARSVNEAFEQQMQRHHHDKNTDDAMALRIDYSVRLKNLKRHAVLGVWQSLSKWKQILAEANMKEELDYYIACKFGPIWDELEKKATERMTYCAAPDCRSHFRRNAHIVAWNKNIVFHLTLTEFAAPVCGSDNRKGARSTGRGTYRNDDRFQDGATQGDCRKKCG
jgi:hypothetical protein